DRRRVGAPRRIVAIVHLVDLPRPGQGFPSRHRLVSDRSIYCDRFGRQRGCGETPQRDEGSGETNHHLSAEADARDSSSPHSPTSPLTRRAGTPSRGGGTLPAPPGPPAPKAVPTDPQWATLPCSARLLHRLLPTK